MAWVSVYYKRLNTLLSYISVSTNYAEANLEATKLRNFFGSQINKETFRDRKLIEKLYSRSAGTNFATRCHLRWFERHLIEEKLEKDLENSCNWTIMTTISMMTTSKLMSWMILSLIFNWTAVYSWVLFQFIWNSKLELMDMITNNW